MLGLGEPSRQQEVDEALRVARQAQADWAATPVKERGRLIYQCGERLREHAAHLVELDTESMKENP